MGIGTVARTGGIDTEGRRRITRELGGGRKIRMRGGGTRMIPNIGTEIGIGRETGIAARTGIEIQSVTVAGTMIE
jgi:hypothetical protein